jgi:hypothetical protein
MFLAKFLRLFHFLQTKTDPAKPGIKGIEAK